MHNLTHSGSVESGAITVAEAAELIGTDRSTIIRWIKGGRLVPVAKLPGRTGSFLLSREQIDSIVGGAA